METSNLKPAEKRREHQKQQQETRKGFFFPDVRKLIEPVWVLESLMVDLELLQIEGRNKSAD